ncbi:MAG: hypothetical protein AAF629_23010 [Chloroflexota bacterium]
MDVIRAEGIPIWVTIIVALIGVMGTALGIMAMLDPTSAIGYVAGADGLALTWAGRNAGLGVALLIAVYLRNASGYAAAIAGSLFRELSDLMSGGFVVGLAIFMLVEVVCFVISMRAALKTGKHSA